MLAETDAVPVRTLLVTVFESIIEVFLLCMAGFILARAGVTDKATQRKLNVINVSLFTPALLFSKVAFSLTPAKLKEMWTIPVGFVIVTGLSAAVAWTLARLFKLSRSQTAFAICAAMFQNSNSLPIALIQSLVVEVPGLKWDDDDSKDQMLGRALTYLVLYSTLGMMLRWSVGVKLLSQADEEAPEVESAMPQTIGAPSRTMSPENLDVHPGNRETDPFFSTQRGLSQDEEDEPRARRMTAPGLNSARGPSPTPSSNWIPGSSSAVSQHLLLGPGERAVRRHSMHTAGARRKPTRTDSGREFWGLPEAPRQRNTMLSHEILEDDSSDSELDEDECGRGRTDFIRRNASHASLGAIKSSLKKVKDRLMPILRGIHAFMTVPMYAALLSIIIAMIPPLQAAMGKIKPFQQAVKGAGQCSIPVTLVVLGAFFYTPPAPPQAIALPPDDITPPHSDGSIKGYFSNKLYSLTRHSETQSYPGENKAVLVAVMSRMVIVPAIMVPIVGLIAKLDPFEAAEDPVFILSAVLLISSPPALTLAQITQAASGDAFERLISKTIFWSYAVLTPPLTLLYVVIGLVFGRW
ncbi:membrane transport protein-domain-containing protein [Kockovaella imperatae]|uniref:Membrane transport protein-domain-containing protein n=1 Tax=Kockovaella imperatae TaxID=4999 RepID=A0A1Y1U620_9TREE|nr:membrane transport protein-domain-containing protein [Kockovaella imperatae]ORX33480.1 membrane transport protein-domain-containing protein [Kockovaella imperatae]